MYAGNYDVIYVNETWLNQNISNSEILHSGFTIFRRDRSDRGGGGVLIAIKTASFKLKLSKNLSLNRKPSCNSLRSFLPKLQHFLVKELSLFCFCYRPPSEDPSWMDVFDNFLHEVCDHFDNMVISGDFNLPDIL